MSDDERIESSLKSIGDAYVRENPPNYAAFREAVLRRRRRRTWMRAGSAAAIAGFALAAALFFTRGGLDLGRSQPPASHVDKAITASIEVGANPSQVNVGGKAVWVSSRSGTLTRIDPVSKETSTIPVGGVPTDIAVGHSGLWVANTGTGKVQHFDSSGQKLLRAYSVAPPGAEIHVSISPGAVWVVVVGDRVWRIDARSGDKTAVDVGTNPIDIAVGEGTLWVLGQIGVVQRYDVATGDAVGAAIEGFPGGDDGEITLGAGALWYGGEHTTVLTRVDAHTAQLKTTSLPSNYVDMGVGQSEVWVLMEGDDDSGTLAAVDPATGRLERGSAHDLTGAPVDVAVGKQALWVINATDALALRIDKSLLGR